MADRDLLIVVFAKDPVPGQVKTRLIGLLGEAGAASFHSRCVQRALATACAAPGASVTLSCAPDTSSPFFATCAAQFGIALAPQGDGDLGTRMQRALTNGLAEHRQVVIIGADCPALTVQHLVDAAQALQHHDTVFIPAEDGGYVLIGARRVDGGVFANIRWGTEHVMAETRRNLRGMGWTWQELPPLWDVDRPEDYVRLGATPLAGEWLVAS